MEIFSNFENMCEQRSTKQRKIKFSNFLSLKLFQTGLMQDENAV